MCAMSVCMFCYVRMMCVYAMYIYYEILYVCMSCMHLCVKRVGKYVMFVYTCFCVYEFYARVLCVYDVS